MNAGPAITTTTVCKSCKANGEYRRLMYTPLGFPKMFCDKGHEFGSAEEAESYVVTPQPEPETPRIATSPLAKPILEAIVPVPEEPIRLPEGPEPDQEDISRGKQPVINPEPAYFVLEAESEAAKPDLATSPTPKMVGKIGSFAPPPARKLPGGVLLMTVRIPDQHVSGLAAEAEIQRQTVEQFLQERLEYALESGWIY